MCSIITTISKGISSMLSSSSFVVWINSTFAIYTVLDNFDILSSWKCDLFEYALTFNAIAHTIKMPSTMFVYVHNWSLYSSLTSARVYQSHALLACCTEQLGDPLCIFYTAVV